MNISTEHWASNVAIIILAVTLTSEIQQCASLSSAQFEVPGYTIHRQDYTHSSGGLFIYARSDIPHGRLLDVEINEYGFESLSIEFPIGKVKTIVFCIYKHPKVTNELFKTYLSQMCDSIVMKCNDFVFIGDMNCCPTKSDAVQYICGLYGLTKLVTQPTCFKGDNPTVIDVTLVSNPRRYIGYLNASFGLSAHLNIIGAATRRFAPKQQPRKLFAFSYKHFNELDFTNDIAMAPFHVPYIFDDVCGTAWFHAALFKDVLDSHAPIKTKLSKKRLCLLWIGNYGSHRWLLNVLNKLIEHTCGLFSVSAKCMTFLRYQRQFPL